MRRRSFLAWFSLGGVISWLISACSNRQATQAVQRPDGFRAVGTVADLNQKGQLGLEQATPPMLVVRSSSQTLVAVNPTCSHQGCTVQWKSERNAFACPCHGATFAVDGKVTGGPAPNPLATYEVKVEGDSVLVKA
jgi:cytochrome b6-f complex iron-sulfur subunit